MRTQLELPNDVAVELAGSQDAVLRALQEHLACKVFLRGNLLTFDGEESETHAGERVVRELSELISRGHQIGPGTIAAVTGALDAHESPAQVLEDVVWRHRGVRVAPQNVAPYLETFDRRIDPRGRVYFWSRPEFSCPDPHPDTDVTILSDGYITVTPLQFNLTHLARLQQMKQWRWDVHG